MPMPKPHKDEMEKEYMDRCMSDKAMNDEFSDNKQRYAVCMTNWKNKGKKKEKKSEDNVNIERRFISMDETELRVERKEGEPTKIVGYFAKFEKMSGNLGGFREKIEPGFFEEALKREDCDCVDLFNHDPNYILGRQSAGTLKIWEDKVGLRYECTAPNTQLIKDLVLSPIERRDIKGCSFGFKVKGGGDTWEENEDGMTVRTLKKGGCERLVDGSQVTFPAYPETDVALRSMTEWKDEKKAAEEERIKKEKEKMNFPEWYVPVEKRSKTEMSLDMINSMLWDAVRSTFSGAVEAGKDQWDNPKAAFMAEAFQTYLVYHKEGKYYQVDWSIIDGKVQFGEKQQEVKKAWVPAEDERALNIELPDFELKRKQLALKEKEFLA